MRFHWPMATAGSLEQGRAAFDRKDWRTAHEQLTAADVDDPLAAADLECLARALYLAGEDEESRLVLERAHHAFLERGDIAGAVRCAFWIGMGLMERGETGRGGGWLARAARLVQDGPETVERGYLLVPDGLQALFGGDAAEAHVLFTQAAAVGQRFGDPDLTALGRLGIGQALLRLGRIAEGMALLDEVMVSVEADEVSAIPAGIIYCAVIESCHAIFDVHRAREWTAALTRWCEAQPDLVPYRGQCLIHRAQILRFHGDWPEAMAAATQACEVFASSPGQLAIGEAHYQRGELHRLRGELDAAEAAYREAAAHGRVPQPGLAQLRVAQGHADRAEPAIRTAVSDADDPAARAAMLAAGAEVALATDDTPAARRAADELARLAASVGADPLHALSAHVTGAVLLVEGDSRASLASLRTAAAIWQRREAPYDAARARVLIALASRELGDDDTAELELETARSVFARLGATPELDRITELSRIPGDARHGLSPREVEVLRLVAGGKSNRAIAADLVISEHTVARHVQNIFTKLGVSSRTEAAAFAFEQGLG
jgi:DNA-binding NarL/FixJ family response regulator